MDERGMKELFRQFSYPGGIPSHVAPETPGRIHEGGELGYALVHAYGAAFDNPDLLVLCVVGDGEAETGPLAASWHSNKFLDRERDGKVLPVLHLNGYKIANPTLLARIGDDALRDLMRGYGHEPLFVEGDEPQAVHQRSRRRSKHALDRLDARPAADDRPAHAEGLDRAEGSRRRPGRGHVPRTPGAAVRARRQPRAPARARGLDALVPPEELFDEDGIAARRAHRAGAGRASAGWARSRTPTAASC